MSCSLSRVHSRTTPPLPPLEGARERLPSLALRAALHVEARPHPADELEQLLVSRVEIQLARRGRDEVEVLVGQAGPRLGWVIAWLWQGRWEGLMKL